MRDIMAIGGGEVGLGETLAIDRIFISRQPNPNPRVLFVPTASDDSELYLEKVAAAYGALGCQVEPLFLLSEPVDVSLAAQRIRDADLIYVGGGNTKKLVKVWTDLGLADVFREVVAGGTPVGGVSAGAICWFRVANSDWPQFEEIPGVNTASLDCLGFVDLAVCPHTRDEGFRLAEFTAMMETTPGVGVGIDDGCALHIWGDQYRILASQPNSQAHLIWWRDGKAFSEDLAPHDDFRPLSSLNR